MKNDIRINISKTASHIITYYYYYHERNVDGHEVVGLDGHRGTIPRPVLQRRAIKRDRRHVVLIPVKGHERPRRVDQNLFSVLTPADEHHDATRVPRRNAVDGVSDCFEVSSAVLLDCYYFDGVLGGEQFRVEVESGLGGLAVGVVPHVVDDPRVELGEVRRDEVRVSQNELR